MTELHDISLLELLDNEWPEGIIVELTPKHVDILLGEVELNPYCEDYDRRLLREPWRYALWNQRDWEKP